MGKRRRDAPTEERSGETPSSQRRPRLAQQDKQGNAAIQQQLADQQDDFFDYARKAVIKVSPPPAQIFTFKVLPPPQTLDNDEEVKAYVLDRLNQGDPLMTKANRDANLLSIAKGAAEDGLPSFIPNVSATELERQSYRLTYELYMQERKAALQREAAEQEPDTGHQGLPTPQPEQTLYFLYDSTDFNPKRTPPGQWQEVVAQVIAYLRNLKHAAVLNPEKYGAVVPSIMVSGYASPEGKEKYNQGLSEDRASVVTEGLAQEIAAAGIPWGEYTIMGIGCGESKELIIY